MVLLISVLCLGAEDAAKETVPAGRSLKLTVKGLRNRKGQLLASLFLGATGFPSNHKLAL